MASNKSYLGSPDNPGTAAVVCYITSIGWLIAYFALYNKDKKSLAAFHLRQTLLLHIIAFVLNLASFLVVLYMRPDMRLAIAIIVLSAMLFVLWVMGLVKAVNGERKGVPFIGTFAQALFSGL